MDNTKGPYILWKDYGYEGWKPESYNSIKECLEAPKYGNSYIITKLCEFEVKDLTK